MRSRTQARPSPWPGEDDRHDLVPDALASGETVASTRPRESKRHRRRQNQPSTLQILRPVRVFGGSNFVVIVATGARRAVASQSRLRAPIAVALSGNARQQRRTDCITASRVCRPSGPRWRLFRPDCAAPVLRMPCALLPSFAYGNSSAATLKSRMGFGSRRRDRLGLGVLGWSGGSLTSQ